jgi:sialate O-acetylesterase
MGGKSFSAMGIYFVLELYAALDIPIGIVGTYWGGTRIEPWTPRCGFEGITSLENILKGKIYTPNDAETKVQKGQKNPKIRGHQQPTVLWNEMVESWCPMAMRGLIWYQGCSNNKDGKAYKFKMKALRDGWAKKFENPDLKIYFVQLAPYACSWFDLQLGQAEYAAEDKNAGMVTTCDIGNISDIHPSEKGTIGKRLAALALRREYGFDSIKAETPTLNSATLKDGKVHLSFNDAEGWYVYSADRSIKVAFELAGEDGKWVQAKLTNVSPAGSVTGKDLILEAEGVQKPVKVRYLFNKPWVGNIYSNWGIPIGPLESEVK